MYWMLSDGWTGQGQIGLDVLKSSGDCGRKSWGAAGAWQVSGNYMLQHQWFRTWVWENNWINEQQIKLAAQRAVLARQWAKQYKMSGLDLDQELVAGSVSLRYRLDAKSLYSPFDALDISFRSNGRSGQQKHVLDSSWNDAKKYERTVPWLWTKGLGYVSDLVIWSSALGTSSGANVCAPTETSGGSGSLMSAVITLKSLDKLKQAHAQHKKRIYL